jgi:TolA-binding protein
LGFLGALVSWWFKQSFGVFVFYFSFKNGVALRNNWKLFFLVLVVLSGCAKPKPPAILDEGPIKNLRAALASGDYDGALKTSKEIITQVPPGPSTEEALYLHGYTLAFGKSDFQSARPYFKQLLDMYPGGRFHVEAQRLLADCQYWQGHYQTATKEYKKLLTDDPGKGYDSYAQVQIGNCLLLDDKVGEALAAYQDVVEKFPGDPMSDSAQLLVANSYLKLQNFKQAKVELQKLAAITHDKDIQMEAQKAIQQLDDEEPFKKGVSDTE